MRCAYRPVPVPKQERVDRRTSGKPQPLETLNALADYEDAETMDVSTVLVVVESSDQPAVSD